MRVRMHATHARVLALTVRLRLHHPHAQIGDIQALFQRETAGTKLHGVTAGELATVALVRRPAHSSCNMLHSGFADARSICSCSQGKVVHFSLLLGPALYAGWTVRARAASRFASAPALG